MKSSTMWPWVPCALFPFVIAVCFTLWAASIGRASPSSALSVGLVAIPCGLLGLSASLIIALIRSYENRIVQLERKLDDGSVRPEEALPTTGARSDPASMPDTPSM